MRHLLATTFIFLIIATSPVQAEVILTEDIQYFTVSGRTQSQIMRSLKANSPMKGKEYFALATTRTQVNYEFISEKKKGRCNVDKATIYLHLTYTYPRLSNEVDKRTAQWWKSQLKSYEKHERTHGDISMKFARKLDREIHAMDDLNCGTIQDEIQRRVKYYYRKMREKQAEFDRREKP